MPKKIEPSVANETQLNAARIVAAVLLGVILGARVSGRCTGLEFEASCGQLP